MLRILLRASPPIKLLLQEQSHRLASVSSIYFFPFFAFLVAGAFSSLSPSGADRLPPVRVLFRVPSVGGFFSFFSALGLLEAFLAVLALGLSAFLLAGSSSSSPSLSSSLVSSSLDSFFFFSSDLGLGAPLVGSFFDPG